jgi:hypothetical protein
MEEALVDIKETSATLISNQQQDKTEVVNEIDKWKRSMNQSSGNINTSEFFGFVYDLVGLFVLFFNSDFIILF